MTVYTFFIFNVMVYGPRVCNKHFNILTSTYNARSKLDIHHNKCALEIVTHSDYDVICYDWKKLKTTPLHNYKIMMESYGNYTIRKFKTVSINSYTNT